MRSEEPEPAHRYCQVCSMHPASRWRPIEYLERSLTRACRLLMVVAHVAWVAKSSEYLQEAASRARARERASEWG